jgi:hypothetical protein
MISSPGQGTKIKAHIPDAAILEHQAKREGFWLVLRRLRAIFGREEVSPADSSTGLFGLDETERARIGTEDDPLRGFEAAMERHMEAERAERSGDPGKAIQLYQTSVAEGFVGSHPYERLVSLHERRHDYEAALRVSEAFLLLAASGKMPKGAQRSADRKRPWFEARIERYRRSLERG